MAASAVFVAASAKNMGKTSACTGLVRGIQNVLSQVGLGRSVGYMKPLGQKLVRVERGLVEVDKDVPVFKSVLGCSGSLRDMSPVVIDKGYTKRCLDGQICPQEEFAKIKTSFGRIARRNDFTVVEGAGHTGVGSIMGLNSPTMARKLGIPLILVLNGGIGSTIDDFLISKQFCDAEGVSIKGVIINKVNPSKIDQVAQYTGEYLEREHQTPVLGYVPDLSSYSSRCQAEKLTGDQWDRVLETADHYESCIDFGALFDVLGWEAPSRTILSQNQHSQRYYANSHYADDQEFEDEEELQRLYGYYAVAT